MADEHRNEPPRIFVKGESPATTTKIIFSAITSYAKGLAPFLMPLADDVEDGPEYIARIRKDPDADITTSQRLKTAALSPIGYQDKRPEVREPILIVGRRVHIYVAMAFLLSVLAVITLIVSFLYHR